MCWRKNNKFISDRVDRIAFGLIAAVLLVRLILAWLPLETLAAWFVPDDSFYYFAIGQNIAEGFGSTFDGLHLTNGYHPLWMGIVTGVMKLTSGAGDALPVHILVTLGALFDAITLAVIYRVARKLFRAGAALWVLALVALSPFQLVAALNGLETSLTIMLFAIFIGFPIIYGLDRWPIKRIALWGALGALLALARSDYGVFPGVIFLWFLWHHRRAFWRTAFSLSIPFFLLLSPWVLWSYFTLGTPIQESGLSLTFTNRQLFFYKDRTVTTVLIWSAYQFALAIHMVVMQTAIGALVYAAFGALALKWLRTKQRFAAMRKHWQHAPNRYIGMVMVASVLFVAIHGALRWTPREWYFVGPQIVLVFVAVWIGSQLSALRNRGMQLIMALGIAGLFIGTGLTALPLYPAEKDMIRAAYWIRENLPENARIASFNSGIYGYLSDRFIMNSDGLVNHDAYTAIKQKQLWEFFKTVGITHYVDYDIALGYRYRPLLGIDNPEDYLQEITNLSIDNLSYHGSTLRAYTVHFDGEE